VSGFTLSARRAEPTARTVVVASNGDMARQLDEAPIACDQPLVVRQQWCFGVGPLLPVVSTGIAFEARASRVGEIAAAGCRSTTLAPRGLMKLWMSGHRALEQLGDDAPGKARQCL